MAMARVLGQRTYALDTIADVVQAFVKVGDETGIDRAATLVAESDEPVNIKAYLLSDMADILALAGKSERAASLTRQALAMAETIQEEGPRSKGLGAIAASLDRLGLHQQANSILRSAFTTSRFAGRDSVFVVLQHRAAMLGSHDSGRTLWQVYEAIREVDGWWDVA